MNKKLVDKVCRAIFIFTFVLGAILFPYQSAKAQDLPDIIQVNIDDYYVTVGYSVWADNALLAMTANASGTIYSAQATSQKNRGWRFDLPQTLNLQAGDTVTVTDGTIMRTYTISPPHVTQIDVDTDTVSGTATPLSNLEVHTDTTITGGGCCAGRWVAADASGNWVADFHDPLAAPPGSRYPTADLVPGSPGQAIEYDDIGNATWVDWNAPNPEIEANLTDQYIVTRESVFPPMQHKWPLGTILTLTVDDPSNGAGTDYTGTAIVEQDFSGWGRSIQTRADFGWPDIGLLPGFIVTVTGNDTSKTLIISSLQVEVIDVESDTITGMASPGATFQVCVNVPNNCISRHVTASGSGNWVANYHDPGTQPDEQETVDIQLGTSGWALVRDEDGDQISADWQAPKPMLWANLVSYDHREDFIWSMGWTRDAIISLEIDDPGTAQNPDYTASQPGELAWWAPPTTFAWFKLQGMFEIQPGYFVRMSDGTYIKTLTVKNISITGFDVIADTISGIAVPGIQVDSDVDGAYRHIMPDAAGNWTADFAHVGTQADEQTIFDIVPGTIIGSAQGDEDGDGTVFTWRVPATSPPVLLTVNAPIDPRQINTIVNATATFTDPDLNDTHTATWDWGDGITTAGILDEDGETINGSHAYTQAGVYTVNITITDTAGESDVETFQYVVIYDPNGGYVTGGGWINSPLGAYTADPILTGKATFGFVSKYQKGANIPIGNTVFQFHVAGMNFKSTSYDWLVIAGTKAQYKGTGTINGTGEYKFMLTAIDGSPDKFRIKIWDKATGEVIYDNQLGAVDTADPITAIQGGSIVVHKAK